jgi:hypothetical protein
MADLKYKLLFGDAGIVGLFGVPTDLFFSY